MYVPKKRLTLTISKQEFARKFFTCLIGTKIRDAYDATVQDNENSAQGTEEDEDSAEEKDKEQTIFSDLGKQSYQFSSSSIYKRMESIKC